MQELKRVTRQLSRLEGRRAGILAERNRLIRAACAEGLKLRDIGAASDLTHGAIANIRDSEAVSATVSETTNGAK